MAKSKTDGTGTHSDAERKKSAEACVSVLIWVREEVRDLQKDPISAALIDDAIESIYEVSGISEITI